MCFELDVGGELCGDGGAFGGGDSGRAPAKGAAEGFPDGGGRGWDGAGFEGVGEVAVDCGVDAVCDGCRVSERKEDRRLAYDLWCA